MTFGVRLCTRNMKKYTAHLRSCPRFENPRQWNFLKKCPDKFQGIHALDSQVAKYFRNFRPTSAFYWNNDSFHTKFNSPGMSGVCFYPNMSTFKNQDLYLPQTCSKSNQRNCLQRLEKIPDDSNWQHVRSWRSDVMEVLPSVVESSLFIARIPWKLSFHYILFH